jgi:hypothetical protein
MSRAYDSTVLPAPLPSPVPSQSPRIPGRGRGAVLFRRRIGIAALRASARVQVCSERPQQCPSTKEVTCSR